MTRSKIAPLHHVISIFVILTHPQHLSLVYANILPNQLNIQYLPESDHHPLSYRLYFQVLRDLQIWKAYSSPDCPNR